VVSGPKEPHIIDPDMSNNSASTDLTVNAIGTADVKISSQALVSPPSQMDVSESKTVTLRKHLHNDGLYGPVDVSIAASASAPPDCTATPAPGNPTSANLPVSTDVAVDEGWTIHCSKASEHTFTFNDAIAITSPHVIDPNMGNNSAQTQLTVTAIGRSDVKVVGVSVSGPAEIDVSADRDITVSTALHNDGPYGPVQVGLSYSGTAPPDCTLATVGPPQVSLPVSVQVVDNHTWTIHCSKPSEHTFSFTTSITDIKDPHVVETNPANNSGSRSYTVKAIAYADMKIVSQYVASAPTEMAVSTTFPITVNEVIHNNGPWQPVAASTNTVVTVPARCTVNPTSHLEQFHNVPVSVDVVYHQPFMVHCLELGSHAFSFDSGIKLKEPHVRDLVPGNDTASTPWQLTAVSAADVKITGIGFVNPPIKIPAGQNVDITLRKHVHNNGPRSPVDIAINATASAPTGCTIVPKSVPSLLSAVPMSVDQVVDEVWTIKCTQEGLKTFVFNNAIDVATAHVADPNPANNTVRKLLTVRDPFYPYWGDDICDGLDNNGNTVIDEGWDLNGNTIADCLDPALDTDGDTLTNDVDTDDDGDGWSDAAEGFMRTDPLNACSIDAYHDAWPPDNNNDRSVDIMDVLRLKPAIGGLYDQRYDLNADGKVNIMDVLLYKPVIGTSCLSP
ncbi:MAG: dockerin type I domain-containing protein, partial [Dehalococcoidia bacterium]